MNDICRLSIVVKFYLVLLILITLWLITKDNSDKYNTRSEAYHGSDYNMSDFTLVVMHYNGRPSCIIQGSNMFHYSRNNNTKIINPITRLIRSEKDIWIATSENIRKTGKNIILKGNVIIAKINNNKMRLTTEKLNIDTTDDIIHTDLPITIRFPHGEIKSIGLHTVIRGKKIHLTSQVQGKYYAPEIN
ncbi:MAG: LPS export ABC transporter periplasmic protein LptC [Piscirickettsiaceae bacterium]|nr:LPS export ABC transporter periplasmic protein LptC [Piscirickettsiaceae bacterium]